MSELHWVPQEEILNNVLDVLQDSFIPDNNVQQEVQAKLRLLQGNSELLNYFLLIFEDHQRYDPQTRALSGLIIKNNLMVMFDNLPVQMLQVFKMKCLKLLTDSNMDVRSSCSALITLIALRGGIENWPELFPVLLNHLESSKEICESTIKTLISICEDYLSQRYSISTNIEDSIKKLLVKFLELTASDNKVIRQHSFSILNDALQKFYGSIKDDFDSNLYLQRLISAANDPNEQIILLVCHGFVIYINNKDENILPLMNDVIVYLIAKTRDVNPDIALQACEFWLSISKIPTCKEIIRDHMTNVVPILLENMKKCPKSLIAPLIKIVIEEVRKACKKHPLVCGFNPADDAYEPLKLMQSVITMTNDICLRYLDNSMLCSLPPPGPPYNLVTTHAIRNSRRRMEDRHVVIHDLNAIFNDQEATPSSYYAVFDGHAGHDAAAYSAAHLHQFLAESKHFASNPEQALKDAFCKTDALFLEKCKVENFSSGTTAVCALHRPKEKSLYVAWVGDSQAVIANQGKYFQCVDPHRPSREDERIRIEKEGGVVMFWGSWRVSGQLAVSRAIGDADYKPYVTAEPDIQEIVLNGTEDFLVLACDGLWDFVKDFDAVQMVYQMIYQNPDDIDSIPQRLVQFSKQEGSADNISVIVVFLREPSKIAAEGHWVSRILQDMDAGLDNANATNNPFANSNGADILATKDDFLLGFSGAFKTNGGNFMESMEHANGKREFDDADDLGPETDVDAVDDGMLSPVKEVSLENAYSMSDFEEKVAMEIDANFQKLDGEKTPREETPTPPVEEVHDGFVDNVAESGDDSEDEWNYIKGEEEAKVPALSEPDQEVADINCSSETDTMSQLNPHAAEFVPISPTRSVESPVGRVLKDEIITQSPKKPSCEIDINLPELQDFENEVKNRPSEILGNGHENGQKLSSQEIMENLLNGKNLDEIEFQPNGTPTKSVNITDEFHFGPNASALMFSTPGKFLDQSETLSTNANFGDESTASYMNEKALDTSNNPFGDTADFVSFEKEQDPMSMSFYQDKDDATDPFDLNKVQLLPDDVDEFIGDTENKESFNETISDLPEHNPVMTTDLDRQDQDEMEMLGIYKLPKSPELKIATPELDECLAPEASDDGIVQNSDLSPAPIEERVHTPESGYSMDLQAKSPSDFDNRIESPASIKSPTPSEQSVEIPKSPTIEVEIPKSPTIEVEIPKSPTIEVEAAKTPEPSTQEFEDLIDTDNFVANTEHENTVLISPEPIEELHNEKDDLLFESHNLIHHAEVHEPLSPTIENLDVVQTIQEPVQNIQEDVVITEENLLESPVDECRLESPLDDVTSSIKDDESPLEPEVHFAQQVSNAIQETVADEISSPLCKEVDEKRIEPESVEVNLCELPQPEVTPSEQIEEIERVCDKAEEEKEIEEVKADPIVDVPEEVTFDNDAVLNVEIETEKEDNLPEENNLSDKITEAAALTGAAVTAMAAAATVAITSVQPEENKVPPKSKPLTPSQAKKTTAKTTPAATKSATKPLASKVAPVKTTTKPSTKPITKTTPSKTAPTTKPVAVAGAATKPKTNLANGDLKLATAKTSTAAKKSPLVSTAPKPRTITSTTKTTLDSAKSATTTKVSTPRTTSTTTAAPKPRPTTLTAKTTTATTKTMTATTKPSSATTTRSTTLPKNTVTQPRPKPASAPPASTRPKVPLAKSTPKPADAEKQDKDKVNKITASRTSSTRTTTTATKAAPAKKLDPKVPTSKVAANKTSTAAKKPTPTEAKIPPIKRPTPKTTKPKENSVPNGVEHKEEEITKNNTNTDLIKDLSPVEIIMDNSQLPEPRAD